MGFLVFSLQMSAAEQLDLFSQNADSEGARFRSTPLRPVIAFDTLDDEHLVAALRNVGIRESIALAAEAGRRRLASAILALEALCRRFAGFGADRIVPEQAAALDALTAIGGSDAAEALVRVIAKGVVQGPCLQRAVSAAAGLRARLPAALVLGLLQHGNPRIRADACRCARTSPEAAALLHDLLDDLHPYVQIAAACALGRFGRREVRPFLLRFLREQPSAELIDAIAPIMDEECVILLGRVADARPDLSQPVLDALDGINHPHAEKIAAYIRESCLSHRPCHSNGRP
jgi:HEAT repeat protein